MNKNEIWINGYKSRISEINEGKKDLAVMLAVMCNENPCLETAENVNAYIAFSLEYTNIKFGVKVILKILNDIIDGCEEEIEKIKNGKHNKNTIGS